MEEKNMINKVAISVVLYNSRHESGAEFREEIADHGHNYK